MVTARRRPVWVIRGDDKVNGIPLTGLSQLIFSNIPVLKARLARDLAAVMTLFASWVPSSPLSKPVGVH